MKVEDNSFDFKVRDRLVNECKEMNFSLRSDPKQHSVMLDMIAYCARGDEGEAVLSLKATKEFKDGWMRTWRRLEGWNAWVDVDPVDEFLFEFWKKSFIELKVAVQKNENRPRELYHEVIMRDHGRFLNELNFNGMEAFIIETDTVAKNPFRATSENLNNIFKDLMKVEEEN